MSRHARDISRIVTWLAAPARAARHAVEAMRFRKFCRYFGHACYSGQCLEMESVTFLVTLKKRDDADIDRGSLDKYTAKIRSDTLGTLLRRILRKYDFDERRAAELLEALDKRNFLVHSFLDTHPIIVEEPAYSTLIQELRKLNATFEEALVTLRVSWGDLAEQLQLEPLTEAEERQIRESITRRYQSDS